MRRIILLCVALLCLGAVFDPSPAAAQCGEACVTLVDVDGNTVGYGCVRDSDSLGKCNATASTCSITPCSGFGFILDAKGSAVAQARLCSGQVRGVESITVVPAREPAALAALARRGAGSPAAHGVERTE